MVVVLGASDLASIGLAIRLAMVALGHDPRVRERMIDHRDLVVEDVGIGFVEVNPLPPRVPFGRLGSNATPFRRELTIMIIPASGCSPCPKAKKLDLTSRVPL
jgi:hypothetical protein